MHTLNVIGPGRVGRTLAALWLRAGVVAVGDLFAATSDGAERATAFLATGRSVSRMSDMRSADVWMVTTPDDRIAKSAAALGASGVLRRGDIVFHCSGALSSRELEAAARCGAHVASVHPLKSFADPQEATRTFDGTWCGAEGDEAALAVLEPAFSAIGGRVLRIEPSSKLIYHAASVIASNYLVGLVEAALRCYEHAGVPRAEATAMMTALMRETLENALHLGTVKALTGPIARGDDALVARQLDTLQRSDPDLAALYRKLGSIVLKLARDKRDASLEALDTIERILTF